MAQVDKVKNSFTAEQQQSTQPYAHSPEGFLMELPVREYHMLPLSGKDVTLYLRKLTGLEEITTLYLAHFIVFVSKVKKKKNAVHI